MSTSCMRHVFVWPLVLIAVFTVFTGLSKTLQEIPNMEYQGLHERGWRIYWSGLVMILISVVSLGFSGLIWGMFSRPSAPKDKGSAGPG